MSARCHTASGLMGLGLAEHEHDPTVRCSGLLSTFFHLLPGPLLPHKVQAYDEDHFTRR